MEGLENMSKCPIITFQIRDFLLEIKNIFQILKPCVTTCYFFNPKSIKFPAKNYEKNSEKFPIQELNLGPPRLQYIALTNILLSHDEFFFSNYIFKFLVFL
jgi:hypothetical protein